MMKLQIKPHLIALLITLSLFTSTPLAAQSIRKFNLKPTSSSSVAVEIQASSHSNSKKSEKISLVLGYKVKDTKAKINRLVVEKLKVEKIKSKSKLSHFSKTIVNLRQGETYLFQIGNRSAGKVRWLKKKFMKIPKLVNKPNPSLTPAPIATLTPTPSPSVTPIPAVAAIEFPVEINWPEGSVKSLSLSTPKEAIAMTVKTYNASFEDIGSARVRPEGGEWSAWISLNNANITLVGYGNFNKGYYGIGGAYQTREFYFNSLPLYPGKHVEVEFRFDKTNLVTTSLKLLEINFIDKEGKKLIATVLKPVDYDNLPSFYTDQANITAGKKLWETKVLLESPNRPAMKARCQSCHMDDGMDLKYFGFSPFTISNRAQFHGLSQQEGDQVAAFIASLEVKRQGNPWDPPLQPGVGQSKKPIESWFAGSGVSSVLNHPDEMLPYIFGDKIEAKDLYFDTPLNQQEVPLPFELPDWNSWLPSIHPDDFLPNEPFKTKIEPYLKHVEDLFLLSPNVKGKWTEALFNLQIKNELEMWHGILLGGERLQTDPKERRKYHDANKLLAVKLLGMFQKYPQYYGRSISYLQHLLFFQITPFEAGATTQIDFRGNKITAPNAHLNLAWWLTLMQGDSTNSIDFRFNYVTAGSYGAMGDPSNKGVALEPISLLFFKKMLEKWNMFEMLSTPFERAFIFQFTPFFKRHPELRSAMVEAILDKYTRRGGKEVFYRETGSNPSQTSLIPGQESAFQKMVQLFTPAVCRTESPNVPILSPEVRVRLYAMLTDVWPLRDWSICKP